MMMKFKKTIEPKQTQVLISDLKVGQIAQIVSNGKFFGHYVLASYQNITDLSDPKNNWDSYDGIDIEINVQLVQDGTIFELKVNNGEWEDDD